MTDDGPDAAACDQREELEHDIREAWQHAVDLGLSEQDAKLLAWACGVNA
jgi:hypothetical protein